MPGRHNMDYTIKTHLQREPATTMLKVNKLKLSNAGTYTVRVTNGVQTKEEKFKLIIRSEPSAQITMTSPQGLYSLVSIVNHRFYVSKISFHLQKKLSVIYALFKKEFKNTITICKNIHFISIFAIIGKRIHNGMLS